MLVRKALLDVENDLESSSAVSSPAMPCFFPAVWLDQVVAAIASMQVAPGEAADELRRVQDQHTIPYETKRTSDEYIIVRAEEEGATGVKRALLFRSAVWDNVNKSTVVPTQEAKAVAQLHSKAKQTKLGPSPVDETSRKNQDTSAGLYMNRAARSEARRVQARKKEADAQAAESRRKAALDRERLAEEKEELFLRFSESIRGKGLDALDKVLDDSKIFKANELLKILQHLGTRPIDMPDKTRPTAVVLLRQNDKMRAIALDTSSSSAAGQADTNGVTENAEVMAATGSLEAAGSVGVSSVDTR